MNQLQTSEKGNSIDIGTKSFFINILNLGFRFYYLELILKENL